MPLTFLGTICSLELGLVGGHRTKIFVQSGPLVVTLVYKAEAVERVTELH